MAVVWELDFYSRPVLDENQKKRWEVLICESPTDLSADLDNPYRYSVFCSNTEVNSITVSNAMKAAIAESGVKPDKVRFFRQSLKNAIEAGCQTVNVKACLSQRTLAMERWIEERLDKVYPKEEGYQASAQAAALYLPPPAARPLPDALLGQKWAVVSLPVGALREMGEWEIDFGEAMSLDLFDLDDDTMVPGVLVFSPRAKAIAAWMSGLEMGFLRIEAQEKPSSLSSSQSEFPDQMILETGVGDRWVFANLPDAQTKEEGQSLESLKTSAEGLHFIAIQKKPDEERFEGFWMLHERQVLAPRIPVA
ncbi:MAG: Tab2/Atab2 family RNA-binding protein [Cyanobacteria bacterium P01_C01_bin.89]